MKTKSIWGSPPKRLYKLISLLEREKGNNFIACIVGCSDGKFLLPFARKGHNVKGYDIDEIALYGGNKLFPTIKEKKKHQYSPKFNSKIYNLEERKILSITERLNIEKVNLFSNIEKRDFYKNPPKEQFDLVFTSCSLHYTANKDFTLEKKTNILKSIVKINGYLYMDYMMAIDESNYNSYPVNKFFRKGEILNYFSNDWEIVSLRENNQPSFEGAHVDCVVDHFHRFGYLFVKRLK